MVRFVNFLFLLLLLGSAFYAYSVKYTTILFSTEIDKIRHEIEKEQIAISLLRAEWAHLTRPERLQALGDRHLDLQPLALSQIVRISDLPERPTMAHTVGISGGGTQDTQPHAFLPSKDDKLAPLVHSQSFSPISSSRPSVKKTPSHHAPVKHKPPRSKPTAPSPIPPASIPTSPSIPQ